MLPSRHLALSVVAGGALWAITGEPWALPITVGAGVFVDGDHVPDLWWSVAMEREPVTIIALHGWEWLVSLMLVGIWLSFPWWIVALLVGYGSHLATDQYFNNTSPWAYLLFYRGYRRFRQSDIDPEWHPGRTRDKLRKELPFALWLADWWRNRAAAPRTKSGK